MTFLSCSGFVEPKNVVDFSQHRDKYAHLGKGSDFRNALIEIDDEINGLEVWHLTYDFFNVSVIIIYL